MSNIMKNLVSFAKIYSIMNKMEFYQVVNVRESLKNDLYNWFQDNIEEIKKLDNLTVKVKTQREINYETFPKLTTEELRIGLDNGKLELVKEYKNRTGKSLLDTKQFVEDCFEKQGYKFSEVYRPRY